MQPTISQLIEIYGHKILILKNLISFVKPVKEFAENTGIVWTDESEDLILEHHYFGKDSGLLPLIEELIELNKLVLSYGKPHQLGDLAVSHYEKMLQEIEKEQKFLGFLRRTLSEVAEHGNYREYWKKSFANYRNLLDVIRGDLTYLKLCRETTAKTAANWIINLIYRGNYDASFHFLDNDGTAKSLGEDEINFFKRLLNTIKSLNLEETDAIVEEGKEVLDVDEYVLLKRVFLTRIKPSLLELNEAALVRRVPSEPPKSPSPDDVSVETPITPEQVAQQLAEEIRLWERLLEKIRTSGPSIRKHYQTALETARNAYAALVALRKYFPEISKSQILERLRKPKFVRLRDRIRISRMRVKDRGEAMQKSMAALRESIALRSRIRDILKSMPGISREQFLRLGAGAAAAAAIGGGAWWLSDRKNGEVKLPESIKPPLLNNPPEEIKLPAGVEKKCDMGLNTSEEVRLESYSHYDINKHTPNIRNRTYEHRLQDHEILLACLLEASPDLKRFKTLTGNEIQYLNEHKSLLEELKKVLHLNEFPRMFFFDIGPGIANTDFSIEGDSKPAITSQEMADTFPNMTIAVLDLPSEMDRFTGLTNNKKYVINPKKRQELLNKPNIYLIRGDGLNSLLEQWYDNSTNPYPQRRRPRLYDNTTLIIRAANSIDIYCDWKKECCTAITRMAIDFQNQPVILFFNKDILVKKPGSRKWEIIGQVSPLGFNHNKTELKRNGEPPFKISTNALIVPANNS